MDRETLTLFIRQLALWASEIIEEGRSPFRKVETCPTILSSQGELSPPLVFWINRGSFMAGGVLLFPTQNRDETLQEGRLCTAALGLKHFATWAQKAIDLWEVTDNGAVSVKTLPLEDSADSPEVFRLLLARLMDEMKFHSVMGSIPGERLAPEHLANLFRETCRAVHPLVEEAIRVDQGANRGESSGDPRELALSKVGLTLCRLLALTCRNLLPLSVHPEGLERAMRFALETLPPHLNRSMLFADAETPLPTQGAVLFHHLLRRLDQVGAASDGRTTEALRILLSSEANDWGGKPLPPLPDTPSPDLLLNADALIAAPDLLEITSSPLSALFALLRDLSGHPPARLSTTDLFDVSSDISPRFVAGSLYKAEVPSAPQRKALTARLRTSWPNRRFPLPSRTPLWAWECIHLLGIVSEKGLLRLNLPFERLTGNVFSDTIFDLFKENFHLKNVILQKDTLCLELIKTPNFEGDTVLSGTFGTRRIPWNLFKKGIGGMLSLALGLPDALFALIADGTLAPAESDTWPAGRERGIVFYLRSSLGGGLWDIASGGKALPPEEGLRDAIVQYAIPLPETTLLERLETLQSTGQDVARDDVDKEISLWLSIPELPRIAPLQQESPRSRDRSKRTDTDLERRIASKVFCDGYPIFPEQYLYDYYRLERVEYTFSPPLRIVEELLGTTLLEDAAGSRLEVEGEETVRALLLAVAVTPSPVSLPRDRGITATITDRYLFDLGRLRDSLLEETHRHVENRRTANRLARKIWASGALPPWEMIAGE